MTADYPDPDYEAEADRLADRRESDADALNGLALAGERTAQSATGLVCPCCGTPLGFGEWCLEWDKDYGSDVSQGQPAMILAYCKADGCEGGIVASVMPAFKSRIIQDPQGREIRLLDWETPDPALCAVQEQEGTE